MKLGFVSAILGDYSFTQMMNTASDMGFQCVEVACWPVGKAERRYAGVSHIDVVNLNDTRASEILAHCKQTNVELSALAFYPNLLDADPKKREANSEHLQQVIRASAKLGVNLVTTFIGRDQTKSVEENLASLENVWSPILALAESLQVRIAIENCPMLFGRDQWPGGQNIMTTPAIWKKVFSEILPSKNLGLNYDPSHFVWQMMDYIAPMYTFAEKIFHVHFKDIKLYPNLLNEHGIMAYPLDYMAPKLPGLGDVNWSRYVSALTDIGYNSYACIEVEDRAFEETEEDVRNSLRLSKRYLEQFVI
ncbi:sugar phosphate isomerase/epimerase [Christensenellaceae bacterium OttesenSCG-928-L17]|nr:sugar phosphate isomerase/epimerase [Christensenellaceae bacterium OttesenSCG-928-L17]